MTIFESIRADHEKQRTLADLLVKTRGDSEGRREIFERLRTEVTAHAAAEERFFYAPLMDHDQTQEHSRHSVAEHEELDSYVERLARYDMSSPQWLQTARTLAERLVHHLDEEEDEVFPVAGRVLDDNQKSTLADEYDDDMQRRRGG